MKMESVCGCETGVSRHKYIHRSGCHHVAASITVLPTANVRFIHNIADARAVRIVLDDLDILPNLVYRGVSEYIPVCAGLHNLVVHSHKILSVLKRVSLDLEPDADYTVILVGLSSRRSAEVIAFKDDNSCPEAGKAYVRFIHGAHGVPPLDLWAGETPIFKQLPFMSTCEPTYMPIDAGVARLTFTPCGTDLEILGPMDITFVDGKVYTLIASGLIGHPQIPICLLITTDNIC